MRPTEAEIELAYALIRHEVRAGRRPRRGRPEVLRRARALAAAREGGTALEVLEAFIERLKDEMVT